MSQLRVHCFGLSLDGFNAAGSEQDLNYLLGVGGFNLQHWSFRTRAFQKMHSQGKGTTGVDNEEDVIFHRSRFEIES